MALREILCNCPDSLHPLPVRRFLIILGCSLLASLASAADSPLLKLTDFRLHDFDDDILASLGYDTANVTYFEELASMTEVEAGARRQYEPIGCHPFYIFKDGRVEEAGQNCGTFFCTGYQKGPKQCRDAANAPYGGLAEIKRRLGRPRDAEPRRSFHAYADAARSPEARAFVTSLESLRCRPFYLVQFDLILGEGEECEEVGDYPFFSNAYTCMIDWRDAEPARTCDAQLRPDEAAIRRRAIEREQSSNQGSSSAASVATPLGGRGGTGTAVELPIFKDVQAGTPGADAILALARRGILQPDRDGNFRPKRFVSRAEFLVLFMGALYRDDVARDRDCLPDITDQWFAPFVCAAKRLAFVTSEKRFLPRRAMIRRDARRMLAASGALPAGTIDRPTRPLTRADAAVWIHEALGRIEKTVGSL